MDRREPGGEPRRVLEVLGSGAVGGATTHVFQLLEGVPAHGFRIALAVDPDGPALDAARRRGFEAIPVPFQRGRLHPDPLRTLRGAIRRLEPALVHAHGSRAALVATTLARLGALGGAALLYSEHGLSCDVPRGHLGSRLTRAAEAVCVRSARRTLVSGEYARQALARLVPGAAPRLRVVANAVAEWRPRRSRDAVRAELGLAPDRLVVGCVARLVPQKGLPDLVAAAARIGAAEPRAAFVVVGDGPQRASVEAAARRCDARVCFTGERSDVADLLAAFDVFALASRWEGTPIAVLEAMSAGLPIVATAVGGVPGIVVDGETGVLVPPGAPDALAAQLLALLRDPGRARRLGDAARARALARHRIEALCDGVSGIYREVLAGA